MPTLYTPVPDAYTLAPLNIRSGFNPSTDNTALASAHFVDGDKVRFYDGRPQKLGGWMKFVFDNDGSIDGVVRGIYSVQIGNNVWYMYGSHTRLYASTGSGLTNITPLNASTTALGTDPVETYLPTLGTDPLSATSGSITVTVTETGHRRVAGDTITLAGATTFAGIPAGDINTSQIIRTVVDANSYTISVATSATSTASGGGSSITVASGLLTISDTAHDMLEGDRVLLAGSTAVNGVPDTNINAEHIIRNVSTNEYDIVVSTDASSAGTGGGGSVTRQEQIAAGNQDASEGRGYGVGRYGVGRYGTSKTTTALLSQPRVWTFDNFGNNPIMTPGGGTGLYDWTGNAAQAPQLVTNAPTQINYVFVSFNIVVVLGAGGIKNKVQWSDIGNQTVWTPTFINQAGSDEIEGATEFISHAFARSVNLLFTRNQVYEMRYIGLPDIWDIQLVEEAQGIISKNARVSVNGVVYYMGQEDFFLYNGGVVSEIPGNTETGENPVRNFVFETLNRSQSAKIFCWYNKKYSEVWWHYCSQGSDEPNRYVVFNTKDASWYYGSLDRTAAEYPFQLQEYPRMIDFAGSDVFRHEFGVDDDDQPLPWNLKTNYIQLSDELIQVDGIIPDAIQTNDITFSGTAVKFPRSASSNTTGDLTITETTDRLRMRLIGRFVQYTLSQNSLGGNFRAGRFLQEVRGASTE